MQVHSFSPSDRKRYVHLSQVSSECLQMINFFIIFSKMQSKVFCFF